MERLNNSSKHPPKWITKFFHWFCNPELVDVLAGDLIEQFNKHSKEHGVRKAKFLYLINTLGFFQPFAMRRKQKLNSILMTIDMLRNYLKIAFRNLLKYKGHTAINLAGLSLGLTVGILILLFVTDELAYDKFHKQGDRIYKIVTANAEGSGMETNAWPVAHKLVTDFPEVEAVVYTRKAPANFMINYAGNRYQNNVFYAGEDFFKIFSFNLIEGDLATALRDPFSIVITEEMKKRYFSSELVLGKTITLRDSLVFTITGVTENIPHQSHIQFDMLASFATYEKLSDWFSYSEGWGNFNVRNYMLLDSGADINNIKEKAAGIYMDNVGDWLQEMGMEFYVDFIPLKDIYLVSEMHNGFGPKSSMALVYLVSAIAIFVIILACINFVNITTARSVFRAKEVGLRKVIGSSKSALFWQFMSEAFILTITAFGTVLILIYFVLPLFNELMGKAYALESLINTSFLLGLFILIVVVTFLAGFYPAIVLSSYKPIEVLSGRMQSGAKGVWLRRSLVIFQFVVSGGLVLATLVALNQMDYMRNMNLGFDKEQILVLDVTRVPGTASHNAFKNSLTSLSGVESVSFNNALPGRPGWQGQWAYPETVEEGNQIVTEYMAIDESYLTTMGLTLLAGNDFDVNNIAELEDGLIINETTMREMGWLTPENAIGKKIVSPSQRPAGTVIGVVKDYHGVGLQEKIWPKAMDYASKDYGRYYAVRFATGNTSELIANAKKRWRENLGDYEFEYFFLDEDFDKQYRSEERLIQVFMIFAILTSIIAGIGLLGLVSFVVLSRVREIGIRKVLGANISSIAILLSKEFVVLVVIANIFSFPLVWYFGRIWLNNFAYHTNIDPTIFLITLCLTLFIAIATVVFQTIKAGKMNPVDVLKAE